MTELLERDLYTIAEAARSLRVSVSTVWRWIDSGRLPAYRVGPRRIRIRKEDLQGMVKPFPRDRGSRMASLPPGTQIFKMSPNEAEDQVAVIRKARALKQEILARRGGELLPPAWQDINDMREERSAEL